MSGHGSHVGRCHLGAITVRERARAVALLAVGLLATVAACERSSPPAPPAPPPSVARCGAEGLREQIARVGEEIQADPDRPEAYIRRGILQRKLAWYEHPDRQISLYEAALQDFRTAHEKSGGTWPREVSLRTASRAPHATDAHGEKTQGRHAARNGSARALVETGRVLLGLERWQEAIAFIEAAAELQSDDPEVRIELARLPGLKTRNWTKVCRDLGAMLRDPELAKSSNLWLSLGIARERTLRAGSPEPAFRRAIELDPDDGAARTSLALYLMIRDRRDEAHELLRENLELNPNDIFSARTLAASLIDAGQLEMAVSVLRAAVERAPDEPELWFVLGNAYAALEKHELALEAYQESADVARDQPSGFHRLALRYASVGMHSEALTAFEGALGLSPDSSDIWLDYADALRQAGQPEQAGRAYWRVVQLDERPADAWNGLGELAAEQERWEDAREAFDEALEVAPKHVPALINLGKLGLRDDRPKHGLEYFHAALEIEPHNDWAVHGVCQALRLSGQHDELFRLVNRLVTETPDLLTAYRWRATEYVRRNDYERALADYTYLLKRGTPDAAMFFSCALTRLLAGGDARDILIDLQSTLNLAPDHGLASLFFWIVAKEAGEERRARHTIVRAVNCLAPEDWYGKIARYYHGELSRQDLLAAADDERRRCEAFYYIAEKIRVEQGSQQAAPWFQKCVELGVTDSWEHRLARWRLGDSEKAASKPTTQLASPNGG